MLGEDLWTLVTDGPEDALNRTVNTQPVMLTAGVAVWRAWQAAGGARPRSSPATASANTRRWSPPARSRSATPSPLVRFRAQAMQDAVPAGVGAMAAILGLDDAGVAAACAEAAQGQVVEPVNFNTPEQVVIAGHREAVERAIAAATAQGAKRGVLLPVSAPFHSSLMKPAAERLAARLATSPIGDARHSRRAQCRRCRRIRSPMPSARRSRARRRARCAGSRRSRRSPRAASRTSSSAARAGC